MDDLTCPICLEVLSDPVMLPRCGHSLCRGCLLSIKVQPPVCPICRVKHEGVPLDKLPTNYIVAALARQQSDGDSTAEQVPVCEGQAHLRKNSFGVVVEDSALHSRISSIAQTEKARPYSTHLPFSYVLPSSHSPSGQRPMSCQINNVNNERMQPRAFDQQTNISKSDVHLNDISEENAVAYRRPNPSRRHNPSVRLSMQSVNNRDMQMGRAHHSTINEESLSEEGPDTPVLPTAPPVSLYADPDMSSHGEISIALTDPTNPNQGVVLSSRALPEEVQSTSELIHKDEQVSTKKRTGKFCWWSFKQCLAGAIMGLTYLYFFASYSWMILFAIFKEDFNKDFEKEYLITTGLCGIPKLSHLSFRILRGEVSCLEKFFFVLYYIFDISMAVVGAFKYYNGDCSLQALIFANSPFVVILGFTAIAFILSITSAPLTPRLKASSGFTKFWGYLLFFLTLMVFIGMYLIMLVLGFYKTGNDKICLLIAGVFGIWTIGHCMFYLIGNGNTLCQKVFRIAFLFYILIWFTLGIVTYLEIFPVERKTFLIVNGPVIIKTGLSLLVWSFRVVTKIHNNEAEEVSAADDIPPHWI